MSDEFKPRYLARSDAVASRKPSRLGLPEKCRLGVTAPSTIPFPLPPACRGAIVVSLCLVQLAVALVAVCHAEFGGHVTGRNRASAPAVRSLDDDAVPLHTA